MFDQQPALVAQVRRSGGNDGADRVQPVGAGCQGGARLEAQVTARQVWIILADIGRIAGNQVETFPGQRREPPSPWRTSPPGSRAGAGATGSPPAAQ